MWDVTSLAKSHPPLILFLLTHPVWDVTDIPFLKIFVYPFLLTHPVWDVTMNIIVKIARKTISTHTSRVGCDDGHTVKFP